MYHKMRRFFYILLIHLYTSQTIFAGKVIRRQRNLPDKFERGSRICHEMSASQTGDIQQRWCTCLYGKIFDGETCIDFPGNECSNHLEDVLPLITSDIDTILVRDVDGTQSYWNAVYSDDVKRMLKSDLDQNRKKDILEGLILKINRKDGGCSLAKFLGESEYPIKLQSLLPTSPTTQEPTTQETTTQETTTQETTTQTSTTTPSSTTSTTTESTTTSPIITTTTTSTPLTTLPTTLSSSTSSTTSTSTSTSTTTTTDPSTSETPLTTSSTTIQSTSSSTEIPTIASSTVNSKKKTPSIIEIKTTSEQPTINSTSNSTNHINQKQTEETILPKESVVILSFGATLTIILVMASIFLIRRRNAKKQAHHLPKNIEAPFGSSNFSSPSYPGFASPALSRQSFETVITDSGEYGHHENIYNVPDDLMSEQSFQQQYPISRAMSVEYDDPEKEAVYYELEPEYEELESESHLQQKIKEYWENRKIEKSERVGSDRWKPVIPRKPTHLRDSPVFVNGGLNDSDDDYYSSVIESPDDSSKQNIEELYAKVNKNKIVNQ